MKPILTGVRELAHWQVMSTVDILHLIAVPRHAGFIPKRVDVILIQIHGAVEIYIQLLMLYPKRM